MIDELLLAGIVVAVAVAIYLLYLSAYGITEWIYSLRERRKR